MSENIKKGGEKKEKDQSDESSIAGLMRQAAARKKAQREVDAEA